MDPLIDRAIGFAVQAHEGQQRKVGQMPYIAHPMGVAMILQQMGCGPAVVAAGLLHDTVEDTGVTLDEIRRIFGDEVVTIVAGCTEPPKKRGNWEQRKMHTIVSIRTAPINVKLVSAADKYHNLSHTLKRLRASGGTIWNNFGRGKEQQAWYYRSISDSLSANVDDLDQYPIFGKLADLVEETFRGIDSLPPMES